MTSKCLVKSPVLCCTYVLLLCALSPPVTRGAPSTDSAHPLTFGGSGAGSALRQI